MDFRPFRLWLLLFGVLQRSVRDAAHYFGKLGRNAHQRQGVIRQRSGSSLPEHSYTTATTRNPNVCSVLQRLRTLRTGIHKRKRRERGAFSVAEGWEELLRELLREREQRDIAVWPEDFGNLYLEKDKSI